LNISSDEKVFNKAAPTYQAALDQSGYAYKLKFNPPNNRKKPQDKKKKHYMVQSTLQNKSENYSGKEVLAHGLQMFSERACPKT